MWSRGKSSLDCRSRDCGFESRHSRHRTTCSQAAVQRVLDDVVTPIAEKGSSRGVSSAGEHLVCNQAVVGSTPTRSTTLRAEGRGSSHLVVAGSIPACTFRACRSSVGRAPGFKHLTRQPVRSHPCPGSSAGERPFHTGEVQGSTPCPATRPHSSAAEQQAVNLFVEGSSPSVVATKPAFSLSSAAEQLAVNQCVPGSSPGGGARGMIPGCITGPHHGE